MLSRKIKYAIPMYGVMIKDNAWFPTVKSTKDKKNGEAFLMYWKKKINP